MRSRPEGCGQVVSPLPPAVTLAGVNAATRRGAVQRLELMSWRQVSEWFRQDPRLLLPVGTCLQHGPHLPLGTDTLIVEQLAEDVSRRTGLLLAPTIPYGVSSDAERDYAGTASLARKTLHRVLNELVDAWERQGLEELILMTAHGYGPHIQALAAVLADTVRVRAVDIHAIDLTAFLACREMAEHAGELDTSLMLYLAPELVTRDEVRDEVSETGAGRPTEEDEPVPARGSAGVVGRPSLSSAETGRRVYEYLVDYITRRLENHAP